MISLVLICLRCLAKLLIVKANYISTCLFRAEVIINKQFVLSESHQNRCMPVCQYSIQRLILKSGNRQISECKLTLMTFFCRAWDLQIQNLGL